MRPNKLLMFLVFTFSSQAVAGLVDGDRAFNSRNYQNAYVELLPLARDNALAAYYVGLMFVDGLWLPQNSEIGVRWLTVAAKRGHTGAQLRLAVAYETGDGVAQDFLTAAQWMLESARGGNADAQYYLGRYFREGQGVIQDDVQAFEWIYRSVEYEISHERLLDALLYLGGACEWGRGLRQDLVEAYKWFSLASSYSSNDLRMRDEASRALDALRIRMNAADLALAGRRAQAWQEEKLRMYGLSEFASATAQVP